MNMYKRVEPNALAAAMTPARDRLLVVDFDETLWLRNSTEEFLASVRPVIVAASVLWLLDRLRPWRIIGGRSGAEIYKDWMRVLAVSLIAPWSLRVWEREAAIRGRRHANLKLEAMIREARPREVVVLSNGYQRIIAPLLADLPLENVRLVASPLLRGARWRRLGKQRIAEDRFPEDMLDHATLVTDHVTDQDLLNRVGNGLLCVWPNAGYRRAFRKRPAAKRHR